LLVQESEAAGFRVDAESAYNTLVLAGEVSDLTNSIKKPAVRWAARKLGFFILAASSGIVSDPVAGSNRDT
jgi:predicted methyltransferase